MAAPPTIEVSTFGQYGVQKVPLQKSGKASDVLQQVSKQLSLKPSSLDCFSLVAGELGSPTLRFEPSDTVSEYSRISLQRRGLNCDKERKLLKTDDVAVHLLFSEALDKFQKNTSALHPTPEQQDKLEEYLDPFFLSERQFLETMQNVQGYNSVLFEGEVVHAPIEHNACIIPVFCKVVCTCSEEFLDIRSKDGELQAKWRWQAIRRWKLEDPDTALFEVTNIKSNPNAHVIESIYIKTKGAAYMLQTARSICQELVYRIDPSKRPLQGPKTVLVGQPVDELYNFVDTALFGTGPYFTKLDNK